MKTITKTAKIILIATLLICLAACACACDNAENFTTMENFSCEQLFDQRATAPPQGGAISGNYLFQYTDTMCNISVYDMTVGKRIYSENLKKVSTYHCNNVNFGIAKFAEDDEFPLLYVSMENIAEHKALVYRVTRTDNNFLFDLVQTITYPDPVTFGNYYPNAIIDGENNFLYLTGYTENDYKESETNKLRITRFALPSVTDGDVTLTEADALRTITLDSITATQGAVVKGGIIYEVFGFDKHGSFQIIDFDNEKVVDKVYLPAYKFKREPESLALYNGQIVCVDVSGKVFRFDLG